MITLIKKLSNKINISTDKLILKYKDYEIIEKYNDMSVKEFFNFPKNKSRPIIYVKIKQNLNNSYNLSSDLEKNNFLYKRNYDNKVRIINYPSILDINVGVDDDIYNVINTFLKETNIISDFICDKEVNNKNNNDKISNENQISSLNIIPEDSNIKLNNNKVDEQNNIIYYIGFPSPDIAFDFNRYMNTLKLINPTYKNIKTNIILSKKKSPKKNKLNNEQNEQNKKGHKINYRYDVSLNLEEKDLEKRNIEILNIVRNKFLNNKMKGLDKGKNTYVFLNNSTPYITPYDERIKDNHENKKKWLTPYGFISSVNKNNGIYI